MPRLFSYGTLRQDAVRPATFGRLLEGRRDELVGFEPSLRIIDDPVVVGTSGKTERLIARHTGNADSRVAGTVFEITHGELARADDDEVAEYVRVTTILASGVDAWAYVDGRFANESCSRSPA